VAAACARNGGELIRRISTVDETRDIFRIRAALGERRRTASCSTATTTVPSD
jgi:hypothetical protein